MNNELGKYFGIVLVILEIILASCLVLLAFIYGIWLESFSLSQGATIRTWIFEGIKRQLAVTIAGLLASWLIHTMNTRWIEKTKLGSVKNSFIFSLGVFIMIFLSGLAGVIIFITQRP